MGRDGQDVARQGGLKPLGMSQPSGVQRSIRTWTFGAECALVAAQHTSENSNICSGVSATG